MAVIKGCGTLSSLGIGNDELYESIMAGEEGCFEDNSFEQLCGDISADFELTDFTEAKYHYLDRATAYSIGAVSLAIADAGLDLEKFDPLRIGLALGSQWGCTGTMEQFQQKLIDKDPRFATPFLFSNSFPNSPASIVSIEYGLKGYNTVYSGAANCGFWAFYSAVKAIDGDRADLMAVVGTDGLSRTVLDFYQGQTPTGEGASCILIGNSDDKAGIRISAAEFGDFELEKDIPVIQVRDNSIYDENNQLYKCGMLMGAAFPMAAALGCLKIKKEGLSACLVSFEAGTEKGYCRLSAD